MHSLTDHQKKVLTQLLGLLEETDPKEDLVRICKFHNDNLVNEDDKYILLEFKKMVTAQLKLVLSTDIKFYQSGSYNDNYDKQLKDFLELHPDSLENNFINNEILKLNENTSRPLIYKVNIGEDSMFDVVKFVQEDLLLEIRENSEKKIMFLNNKLNESSIKSIKKEDFLSELKQNTEEEIRYKSDETRGGQSSSENKISDVRPIKEEEKNPYPRLFISAEVYHNFIVYTNDYIVDFLLDYGYLKRRLEHEKLIHKHTDKDFMRLLYDEMKLFSEKKYLLFMDKPKFVSLPKATSANRENHFNLVFMS